MDRPRLFGFVGGLLAFVAAFGLLRALKVPFLGGWEILIAVLGFAVILAGAAYTTNARWPTVLTAAGGILLIAGYIVSAIAIGRQSVIGILLAYILDVVGFILLTAAMVSTVRNAIRRWKEGRWDF